MLAPSLRVSCNQAMAELLSESFPDLTEIDLILIDMTSQSMTVKSIMDELHISKSAVVEGRKIARKHVGANTDSHAVYLLGNTGLLGLEATYDAEDLTNRESEVITRIAEGKTRGEIGSEFGVSPSTIKATLGGVYRKFAAKREEHAIRRGFEVGFFAVHETLGQDTAYRRPGIEGEMPLTTRQLQRLDDVSQGRPHDLRPGLWADVLGRLKVNTLASAVSKSIQEEYIKIIPDEKPTVPLTTWEELTLLLVAGGMEDEKICGHIGLTLEQLAECKRRYYRKLGAMSDPQAVRRGYERRILNPANVHHGR